MQPKGSPSPDPSSDLSSQEVCSSPLISAKPQTLVDLLRLRACRQPTQVAYSFLAEEGDSDTQVTYEELDRRASAVAGWFQSFGAAGQRAILLLPQGIDYITAFFGCLYADVVAVPAYPPRIRRSNARLEVMVADSQARFAITSRRTLSALQLHHKDSPLLTSMYLHAIEDIPSGAADSWRKPSLQSDTLAYLQYTSGSTADPRGVMIRHENVLHNVGVMQRTLEISSEDRGVNWLPLYHDMGLVGSVILPLFVGGPTKIMTPLSFMRDPFIWLKAISRSRATHSGAPNFAYDLCVQRIPPGKRDELDLSSWEVAFNGAEPIRYETMQRFADYFAPCGFRRQAFLPVYGLAESTLFVSGGVRGVGVSTYNIDRAALERGRVDEVPSASDKSRAVVSSGRVPSEFVVRIVDPVSLRPCPPEQIGEIWVASPSVAEGYWNQSEQTSDTFSATLPGDVEHRYLRTGDLGFLRDNQLTITGRIKNVIILRGRNLYPEDLQHTAARSHPSLIDHGGTAFSTRVEGEEQIVIVHEVERKFCDEGVDEILLCIRQQIVHEHGVSPYAVVLVKAHTLPRTSSNKLQHGECRKQYQEGKLQVQATWKDPLTPPSNIESSCDAYLKLSREDHHPKSSGDQLELTDASQVTSWIINQIAQRTGARRDLIGLDEPLTRFGLDSLAAVEIQCELEQATGRKIPNTGDETGGPITIRRLVRFLSGQWAEPPESADLSVARTDGAKINLGVNDWSSRLVELAARSRSAQASGDYIYQNPIASYDGAWVSVEGRRMLMLASYSYLGLLGHPRIESAAKAAVDDLGTGSHGVPLLAGTTVALQELERAIAQFKGTEAAVVFSSGYVTNLTTISSLLRPGDVVIGDQLNHASIVDGCRLSQATLLTFRHNDMNDLEHCLQMSGTSTKLVVVDAVFSMDGDIVDLPRVAELCNAYEALLMVDEAHSLGVLGKTGHGIEEHFGLGADVVDIKMGTLSKTVPSTGGYVAGSTDLIDALKHNTRAFIFSAALSPPQAAAATAAFEVIEHEPDRVATLWRRREQYITGLQRLGVNTLHSQTPVVPIICPSEETALRVTMLCRCRGLFVVPVIYPAVPLYLPRLRTTVTAAMSEADIDFALEVIRDAATASGLIKS